MREIITNHERLPSLDGEGDGFFYLKIDGMNFFLRFEKGREKVCVVFQRHLKTKIDYSHEVFYPQKCEWGREGKMPPRGLFIRGLIYDFLHGLKLEGNRIDFQMSEGPFMPDWANYKRNPIHRAPWPPLP
uniref:Uncharacterized protein n=1 Tax=mine drainage metagenome TaxID=410659 RepID=E6QKI7_9ZZZZ